jgi:hypothetical protein
MNDPTARGLAVLALLSFALPRAEALTITFGPQHSATFLDVTIDASPPPWVDYETGGGANGLAAQDGWNIRADIAWTQGAIWLTTSNWGVVGVRIIDCELRWPLGMLGPTVGGIHWTPSLGVPTRQTLAPYVVSFKWDIATAVPDRGIAAVLFAGPVFGLLAFHRRRETPSPRALRGV